METLLEILAALESDEKITITQVADALRKRWPAGVIVAVLERDDNNDTTDMLYGWRGSFFATLGMVTRMKKIMQDDDDEDVEP